MQGQAPIKCVEPEALFRSQEQGQVGGGEDGVDQGFHGAGEAAGRRPVVKGDVVLDPAPQRPLDGSIIRKSRLQGQLQGE